WYLRSPGPLWSRHAGADLMWQEAAVRSILLRRFPSVANGLSLSEIKSLRDLRSELPSATIKPAGQIFLDHPPWLSLSVGHSSAHRAARGCGRLASRWLSAVLAMAVPATWHSAQDRRRHSGLDLPFGGRNPDWGAPKIHGERQKLVFVVSERTIARY